LTVTADQAHRGFSTRGLSLAGRDAHAASIARVIKYGLLAGSQEQSQMMTSANGTPIQMALPITDAKPESKLPSERS
jgi:hypothetical protein